MDFIQNLFTMPNYYGYVMELKILSFLVEVIDILTGVRPIEYNGEMMSLYELFFNASPISAVFWGITLIGMALAIGFSIVAVTRRAADLEVSKSMGDTLGQIGKTLLMFFITPIMMLTVMSLSSLIMTKTDEIFYQTVGASRMDNALFALTARDAAIDDPGVIARFASGELDYANLLDVIDNINVHDVNVTAGRVACTILIIFYAVIILILLLRIFMMLVLYLLSPFFISSMVLDDGSRYKVWREAFFGKIMSAYSLLIAMKLLTFVIVPFILGDVALSNSLLADLILKLLFFCGCVFGVYKSTDTLIKIIAPNEESEDTKIMTKVVKMAARAATLPARMAWNATKSAVAAIPDAVYNGIKGGLKLAAGAGQLAAAPTGVAAVSGGATVLSGAMDVAKATGGVPMAAVQGAQEEIKKDVKETMAENMPGK